MDVIVRTIPGGRNGKTTLALSLAMSPGGKSLPLRFCMHPRLGGITIKFELWHERVWIIQAAGHHDHVSRTYIHRTADP
jgi:hypothetical protein